MSSFKSTITLKQITPMIHFQAEDYGACLRASDVKPRLDAFLLRKCSDIEKEHKDWFVDPDKNKALDYRLTVCTGENPKGYISRERQNAIKKLKGIQGITAKHPSYLSERLCVPASYFGNMVDKKNKSDEQLAFEFLEKYREAVLYTTPIEIGLFSRHTQLLKLVEDLIVPFFLTHNFGTRADKGLGSFVVTGVNGVPVKDSLSDILKKVKECTSRTVFYIDLDGTKYTDLNSYLFTKEERDVHDNALTVIRMVYALMKSGINLTKKVDKTTKKTVPSSSPDDYFKGFIFRYFMDNENVNPDNKGNDKKFMKNILFDGGQNEDDFLYVRGLLGTTDGIQFRDEQHRGTVSINAMNSEKIKRVPSPILFKVIPDAVLIIPGEVDKRVLGADFKMGLRSDKGSLISVPKQFDLISFLEDFMIDFNDKETPKGGRIGLKDAKNSQMLCIKNIQIQESEVQG